MNPGGSQARLIDGRFELLERLGGGGMGLVWRARDTALDREVALKEVRPPDYAMLEADPTAARQMRERVLREARSLARLQNQHVVIIHHIVDSAEQPYPWLVMELVNGGSLADRLERGPLAVPEAARIGRGVLSALRAAHAAGIQHRDVKPGNVLLRAGGTPVLTDFGIAAVHGATALTATGALIGSPEYIAPERIRGKEGDPSSDLWSLGMMLYVAVEGHHPLRRSTTLATLAAVLDEPLPPPVRCGPLGPLLSALLAKDPATRPDAEQLDRMLGAVERDGSGYGYGNTMPLGAASWGPASGTGAVGAGHPGGVAPAPAGYPGAFGPPPAVHAGATAPAGRPAAGKPPARRGPVVAILSVTVVALAGGLAWTLLPGVGHGTAATGGKAASGGVTAGPAASSGPKNGGTRTAGASGGGGTATAAAPAAPGNLLTPAGMRTTVKAIRPYTPGGQVAELVVYPGYADAEAPTRAGSKLYNDVYYRDGAITHEPGGTLMDDETTVSLDGYDWDVLPSLLAKAQKTLNVPHPTSRYVIVGPDLFTGKPTISVYLSDSYGSGYLAADEKGRVQRTYPRDS